jgi:hypothetical protein
VTDSYGAENHSTDGQVSGTSAPAPAPERIIPLDRLELRDLITPVVGKPFEINVLRGIVRRILSGP